MTYESEAHEYDNELDDEREADARDVHLRDSQREAYEQSHPETVDERDQLADDTTPKQVAELRADRERLAKLAHTARLNELRVRAAIAICAGSGVDDDTDIPYLDRVEHHAVNCCARARALVAQIITEGWDK